MYLQRQGDAPKRSEFQALLERVQDLEERLAELEPKPRGRPKNGNKEQTQTSGDS